MAFLTKNEKSHSKPDNSRLRHNTPHEGANTAAAETLVRRRSHHTMSNDAHITIQRGESYADRLRAYKVAVDGVVVASVRAGQSVTVPVSAGNHTLRLRIDWGRSEELKFQAGAGERITFECGSSLAGWRVLLALFYAIFWSHWYLWLRRAT